MEQKWESLVKYRPDITDIPEGVVAPYHRFHIIEDVYEPEANFKARLSYLKSCEYAEFDDAWM